MKATHLFAAALAAGSLFALGSACLKPTFDCSPASCSGCCDSTGECQLGDSAPSCGAGGAACSACAATQVCQAQACVERGTPPPCPDGGCANPDGGTDGGTDGGPSACGPANCNGCCVGTGASAVCQAGTSVASCGKGGLQCASCIVAAGQACEAQACVPSKCSAATCAKGCCSGFGSSAVCRTGTSNASCGNGGVQCQTCAQPGVCLGQTCLGVPDAGVPCSSANCPNGCCAGFGQFSACMGGGSNNLCGKGGQTCQQCSTMMGQVCVSQACSGAPPVDGGGPCSAATCPNGCCSAAGVCRPGNSVNACGNGGAACLACSPGACVGKQCTSGPVDAGMASLVGTPCTADATCAALGGNYKCKQLTNPGLAPYPGGYCTKLCVAPTDCPVDAVCEAATGTYGESDSLCLKRCGGLASCRTPGYACYTVGPNQACWLSPLPDAGQGPAADKIGIACSTNPQCQNPPSDGACLPPSVGGAITTGYVGGYCTAPCTSNAHCGDGGVCTTVTLGPQSMSLCLARCTASSTNSQGSCRTSYVCDSPTKNPANDAGISVCRPNCGNAGYTCPAGLNCLPSGYCG